MDALDRMRQYEEENFQTSRTALGETYGLLADMLGLYDVLGELIRESKLPSDDEIVAGAMFMLGSRYMLEKSILELMRVHLSDSFSYVRNALEQVGFADLVRRNPKLAMKWLSAGDDPAAYKEYKDAFATGKAFPKNDPLMQELYTRYDFASKRVHASLHSYALRLQTLHNQNTGAVELKYAYFDIKDASDLMQIFLWIIDTHFKILQAFARVFAEAIRYDQRRWDLRYNAVEASLAVHKERWKPLIAPQVAGRSIRGQGGQRAKG